MKRALMHSLLEWKLNDNRKPLLLMGVRQVGKTYLLKELGQQHFVRVHYINFELDKNLHVIFEKDLDPKRLVQELALYLGQAIDRENDLLIMDEIQACPSALTSLKYFNEMLSELAIAAAGSLLGLHLNETAFPVGQVDMLYLYPMSFHEFLQALDENQLIELLAHHDFQSSLPEIGHRRLWEKWKMYLITGGLPEVVATYVNYQESLIEAFLQIRKKQKELVNGYYADIAKHAGKTNAMHITRVWEQVGIQLAGVHEASSPRFKVKGILPNVDRYQRLANVIDWLVSAHLVIKIPLVNSAQIPLKAYTKESFFKLFYFDIGILGSMMELSPKEIYEYDFGSYKGYFVENFVAQALQTSVQETLYSWQEKHDEIEFIQQIAGKIIPIEVKSGNITRAKSLQKFIEKYAPPYAIVFSGKNISFADDGIKKNFPLYLAGIIK